VLVTTVKEGATNMAKSPKNLDNWSAIKDRNPTP